MQHQSGTSPSSFLPVVKTHVRAGRHYKIDTSDGCHDIRSGSSPGFVYARTVGKVSLLLRSVAGSFITESCTHGEGGVCVRIEQVRV